MLIGAQRSDPILAKSGAQRAIYFVIIDIIKQQLLLIDGNGELLFKGNAFGFDLGDRLQPLLDMTDRSSVRDVIALDRIKLRDDIGFGGVEYFLKDVFGRRKCDDSLRIVRFRPFGEVAF